MSSSGEDEEESSAEYLLLLGNRGQGDSLGSSRLSRAIYEISISENDRIDGSMLNNKIYDKIIAEIATLVKIRRRGGEL